MPPAAIGAAAGVAGGLLGGQKGGGANPGNLLIPNDPNLNTAMASTAGQFGSGSGPYSEYYNPDTMFQSAARQIQNNLLLSQSFGQNGLMNQTGNQISSLMNQGFQLTPEDRTAYGQISGDIARQFDSSDQSLANALAARGLSSSGVANMDFAGSEGNKREQLAQQQQQIAQNRMQMAQNQLNSARNFYGQLQQQGMNQLNNQTQANYNTMKDRAGFAQGYLGAEQGQQNNATGMERSTQSSSPLSNAFNGLIGGAMAGSLFGGGGAGGAALGKDPSQSVFGNTNANNMKGSLA